MRQTDYMFQVDLTSEMVKDLINQGWNLVSVNTITESEYFRHKHVNQYHFVKYDKQLIKKIK